MHDEGTGGNTNGGYGIFPLFPLANCSFTSCPVALDSRKTLRAAGADGMFQKKFEYHSSSCHVLIAASPGYFTTTFTNGIKLETTSTRRAGLIRFTYPSSAEASVVIDLANDLQRSFQGAGSLDINSTLARVTATGTYLQSYGTDNYTAYACYDFAPPSGVNISQPLLQYGTYQSVSSQTKTNVTISPNSTSLVFPFAGKTLGIEAGALLQFSGTSTVLTRFGVSFISTSQACANAETEIPDWSWNSVQTAFLVIEMM